MPRRAAKSITRRKLSANMPGLTMTWAMPGSAANCRSTSQISRVISDGWAGLASHWLSCTMALSPEAWAATAKAVAAWVIRGWKTGTK